MHHMYRTDTLGLTEERPALFGDGNLKNKYRQNKKKINKKRNSEKERVLKKRRKKVKININKNYFVP